MKCLFDYAAGLRKKKAVQYEFYMSETNLCCWRKDSEPSFCCKSTAKNNVEYKKRQYPQVEIKFYFWDTHIESLAQFSLYINSNAT